MPATSLSENYCVCVGEDGAPHEMGHSGTTVTYKAMGYQSGQAVALQLIPLTSLSETGRAQIELKSRAVRKLKHPNIARVFDLRVEDDHIVLATEYLEGETAEAWVVAHGPMPPDAVVRIGLQVVSALAEAAFHSLSHRSIQASNLMIVSGAAPDGDWPFVKLVNFGLAGLKLYSESKDELAPPIAAGFASPEQLEHGKVDFRSEIFSLGATMCFLLTGAVPLTGRARKSGASERVLPSRRAVPRSLRKLLQRMLRINPDERPQDPLNLADELRKCLGKVKRRRPRSLPLPIPLEAEPAVVRGPRPRFLVPILTGATMLLLFAALATVLLPGQVRWWSHRNRPLDSIGVPIGVPENALASAGASEDSSSPAPVTVTENSSASPPAALAVETSVPSALAAQPRANPVVETSPISPPAQSQATVIVAPLPAKADAPIVANSGMANPPPAERLSAPSQPSASAPPTASVPVIAENSPVSEAAPPAPTTRSNPAERSRTQDPPLVAQDSKPPPPAESPSATPAQVAVNNRMAEPPPPAEAPSSANKAPSQDVEDFQIIAEQPEPQPNAQGPSPDVAAREVISWPGSSPAPSVNPTRPKIAGATTKSARSNSVAGRRSNVRRARERAVPPMRVGSTQARLVGTTDEGKWILQLSSGNTVVTPPLPDMNDAPVISHRKVRKVQAPPHALPVDERPVVVLPPQD